MAVQTINNGEYMSAIRGKINTNFTLTELIENKVNAIGTSPSTTKYPSEKAVADYTSKIYLGGSIPTTKPGDLIFHTNAPSTTGGSKGKLKVNSGGTLTEFIPDRSICVSAASGTVLLPGELGVASDGSGIKVGDGSTPFSTLAYVGGGGGTSSSDITYGGNNDGGYGIEYQNGWIKFPNGMIIQWGLATYAANGYSNFDREIYLPVAFTKKRIYSHGVLESGNLWNDKQLMVHPRGIGTSSLRFVVEGGLAANAPYELHWMAIGF